MKERTTYIVEFYNHKNQDGSLTDIKLYINEWHWEDGEVESYELYDYVCETVNESELTIVADLDQVMLTKFKEMAITEVINCNDRYIERDLGGSL